MARNQPSTLDLRRVTNHDIRQESKNATNTEKVNTGKFNTGVNIEAVMGALSQLIQTFTNKALDNNSVNMSLLLRTVYRNLSDDLVKVLSKKENVDKLNEQIEKQNEQIAASEKVTVNKPKVIETVEEKERTEKYEPIIEKKQITEKTERVTLPTVSKTHKDFAAGKITDAEDVDVLELAQDFINELQTNSWALQVMARGLGEELTEKYDEFVDKIDEDDEDEWNLYRYMYRKQAELEDDARAGIVELLKKGSEAKRIGNEPRVEEVEGREEEPKEEKPVSFKNVPFDKAKLTPEILRTSEIVVATPQMKKVLMERLGKSKEALTGKKKVNEPAMKLEERTVDKTAMKPSSTTTTPGKENALLFNLLTKAAEAMETVKKRLTEKKLALTGKRMLPGMTGLKRSVLDKPQLAKVVAPKPPPLPGPNQSKMSDKKSPTGKKEDGTEKSRLRPIERIVTLTKVIREKLTAKKQDGTLTTERKTPPPLPQKQPVQTQASPTKPDTKTAVKGLMNKPKPTAAKQPPKEKRNLVTILKSQFDKLRTMNEKRKHDKLNSKVPDKMKPPKTPLGLTAKRAAMSDDEAFRRNISEGGAALNEQLGEKEVKKKYALPHKKIGKALEGFMDGVKGFGKKLNSAFVKIENRINAPGLFKAVFGFILKTVIGGLIGIGLVTWFRSSVLSWLPRDSEGKFAHGPKLFGVQLPNFKDIIYTLRSGAMLAWTKVSRFFKNMVDTVKRVLNGPTIKGAGGAAKFFGQFIKGFIAGIAANAVFEGGGPLGQLIWGILGAIPGVGAVLGTIKTVARIASMIGGVVWAAITDIFGGKSDGGVASTAADWGEQRLEELTESEMGKGGVAKLIESSKKIKPLVALESIMPDTMKVKTKKGNIRMRAISPKLKEYESKFEERQNFMTKREILNKESKELIQGKKDSSSGDAHGSLRKGIRDMALQPRDEQVAAVGKKWKGDNVRHRAAFRFYELARLNIAALEKAKKEVGQKDNMVGSVDWSIGKWVKKPGEWNPEFQYIGKNADLLKSVVPQVPFQDNRRGLRTQIANAWTDTNGKVRPMAITMLGTGTLYTVDMIDWEKQRIDMALRSWGWLMNKVKEDPEYYNSKDFIADVDHYAKRWSEMVWAPPGDAQLRRSRIRGMSDAWNEAQENADLQPKQKPATAGAKPPPNAPEKKPEAKEPEPPAEGDTKIKRPWAATDVQVYDKKEEKAPPPPPPPPPPKDHGILYIKDLLEKHEPWPMLGKKNAKAEDLRKLFGIDEWFNKEPPSDEKVYKEGPGKAFYNILMELGFVYDKAVWQNPKFLMARGPAIATLAESINRFVSSMVSPHGEYLQSLLAWAEKHKTQEEQDAVLEAAKKEADSLGKEINRDKFMEYIAKYYVPTGIHLVILNKEGKVLKEKGKELYGFNIPKELYDKDPKYWDDIMNTINNSAIPPKDMAELHETRAKLMMAINENGTTMKRYVEEAKLKLKLLKAMQKLSKKMLDYRMELVTKSAAETKLRIDDAKEEIDAYFIYRRFLNSGSVRALKQMIDSGNWLISRPTVRLFSEKPPKNKTMSEKILGSTSMVIADRRRLIRRMRAIIRAVAARAEKDAKKQSSTSVKSLLGTIKSVKTQVVKMSRKAAKEVSKLAEKNYRLVKDNAEKLSKATAINFKLFKLFGDKEVENKELSEQAKDIAKEMVPKEDKDGTERIEKLVKLVKERKQAATNKTNEMGNYWENLKREWKDKISEESMSKLKFEAGRLSNNIMDYVGLVSEIPAGNTTVVSSQVQMQPSVVTLLPDIVFCQ